MKQITLNLLPALNLNPIMPSQKKKRKEKRKSETNWPLMHFPFLFFFFLSNWPLTRPGWSGGWAALHGNCTRHCHDNPFYGQKRQQKRRKYNGINWRGSGWQNTWNTATFFPVWKLMCVTLSKHQTQWGYFVHARLLNHSPRHTSCDSDTPFRWCILQKNEKYCRSPNVNMTAVWEYSSWNILN